jgi:hypothetical protein
MRPLVLVKNVEIVSWRGTKTKSVFFEFFIIVLYDEGGFIYGKDVFRQLL